jgi:hypothetical protein
VGWLRLNFATAAALGWGEIAEANFCVVGASVSLYLYCWYKVRLSVVWVPKRTISGSPAALAALGTFDHPRSAHLSS